MLQKISTEIKELLQSGQKVQAIFDLDSTVFDVSTRISKILHDFAANPRNQKLYPLQSQILRQIAPHPQDYGVRRTLERYDFPREDKTFFYDLVDFWKQSFFSGNYLKYDQPYPGSVEFIKDLAQAGTEISYLTGRDVPRMRAGTLESLEEHGFPVTSDGSNLILKPNSEISDIEFKKRYFQNLKTSHVWFFENEPANILICMETAPFVHIVFVDTVHSGNGPLPPDTITRIKQWANE